MLGSPYYQNWQHVYTAVTRGVQRVLIINDPTNLKKVITSRPIPRKTNLQEDLSKPLVNIFSQRTHVLQSVGCNKRNSSDQLDATFSDHEIASDCGSFYDQTTMASPPKRKLLESPAHLSPPGTPETPKSLRNLKESLSAVTPFKKLSEYQNTAAATNSLNTTPSKRRTVFAKHSGTCVVCHRDINKGDSIAPLDDLCGRYGYQNKWVHEGCAQNWGSEPKAVSRIKERV